MERTERVSNTTFVGRASVGFFDVLLKGLNLSSDPKDPFDMKLNQYSVRISVGNKCLMYATVRALSKKHAKELARKIPGIPAHAFVQITGKDNF